jgi:hypothetical protein
MQPKQYRPEIFEKCSILFKVKEDDIFNHRNTVTYVENLNLFGYDAEIGRPGTHPKGMGLRRALLPTPSPLAFVCTAISA